MGQNFVRGKSLIWVFDKQSSDDIFGLVADRLPHWCVEVEVDVLDLFKQHEVILIEEGWCSAQQDVEHNTYTPQITTLIVRELLQNFRRHIARRAAGRLSELFFLDGSSQTKIRNLDYCGSWILCRVKQVLRLDVTMHNAQRMAVLYGVNDRHD